MARRGARKPPARLVAVGASMGGVEALRTLFGGLGDSGDAAFVVVLHRSEGVDVLPAILARDSGRPAVAAHDGQALAPGIIYVAPAGLHTRVADGHLDVDGGPRENGHRPSIDALFRSAARSYAERAIGVVLSGALDDSAAGLAEIKRWGGLALVQDPRSALNPEMPMSALSRVAPDRVAAPDALATELARLLHARPPRRRRRPPPSRQQPASLVCPDCDGPLWTAHDDYRCRVGHRFSPETLVAHKEERLESALWSALNIMQERVELSRRMAARARENGHPGVAARYEARARDTEESAALLRDLVYRLDGARALVEPAAGARAARRSARRRGKPSV